MALPATWALPRGNKTLRRRGGAVVPGVTSSDALSLTGAAATAGWGVELIADEFNVTRWMLTVSGTAAQAPPSSISSLANGTTVTGTLTSGASSCAVTITIENPAFDVRPKWSDTTGTTGTEIREVLINTVQPVTLGDRIRLQPGTYGLIGGVKSYTQRIRFLTPQGTWNGSNWVKISPRTAYEAVWQGLILDSASAVATNRNAYLWFEDIDFSVPLLDAGMDPNAATIFSAVTTCNYVGVNNNKFSCPETIGVPPTGVGRDLSSGIVGNGSFWYITNNTLNNVWNFGSAASLGDTLVVTNNDARNIYNDGFKTNHYNITFEDNFITNKRCADPQDLTGSNGVHPDTAQHLGWSDGASRTVGTYKRNIMVRGDGRAGWPDGQGLFLDDSKNGSNLLGLEMENNFIIMTMQNGITIVNSIDPLVRGNVTILDPTVGGIVNTNTGTDPLVYYPRIGFGVGAGSTASGGILSGNVSTNATAFGDHFPRPVETNNIVLDANAASGASSYSANFANPEFGAVLDSRAAVIARFKPKPGGAIDTANAGPWDTSGNWRTYGAATAVTMLAPAGGPELAASANFTIGANGSITGTVTVTPSDGGAGGTFTPPSVAISSGTPTATFTYTPPAGSATRTISVTNNGSLTNPTAVSYVVNAPSATTVTLSGPDLLLVGTPATLTASVDGTASGSITISLDPVSGVTFGDPIVIEDGASSGSTTITATTVGTKTISGTNDGGLSGPASINIVAYTPVVISGNVAALVRCGFIAPIA